MKTQSLAQYHGNRIRALFARDMERLQALGDSAKSTFEGALLNRMKLLLEYVDELEADLAVYMNDDEEDTDEEDEGPRLD